MNLQQRGDPSPALRRLLMVARQVTIMLLGALEDYLGLERSIIPRHRREER